MSAVRVHLTVRGRVQGVGYRYFTRRAAQRLGVSGWVRNCGDGSVEAEAQAETETLARFVELLREGPSGAHVSALESHDIPVRENELGFEIRY